MKEPSPREQRDAPTKNHDWVNPLDQSEETKCSDNGKKQPLRDASTVVRQVRRDGAIMARSHAKSLERAVM